jgi:5'-nucleotidase
MNKPTALVTNDDGIDSYFLQVLVHRMQEKFEVFVAAPASEQSWIGRGMTRRDPVTVDPFNDMDVTAWKIGGTPTDCVNIALGSLLDEKPDIVVSGINLGMNVTLPMILASGTVAGALEGSFWGIPSIAFSQNISSEEYDAVREVKGHQQSCARSDVDISSQIATDMALELLENKTPLPFLSLPNINFAAGIQPDTKIEMTRPGCPFVGSLFAPPDDDRISRFSFNHEVFNNEAEDTDIMCLRRGHTSYLVLDYSILGGHRPCG